MTFPYDFTALQPPLLEQTTNDCKLQSLKNDGWNPGPFEVIECFSLTTGVRIHAQNLSSVLWHGTVMYMSHTRTCTVNLQNLPVKSHPFCGGTQFWSL